MKTTRNMLDSLRYLLVLLLLFAPLSECFASKKKGGGNKKTTASTNRGFGAPPPTLEETCRTFRTRLPKPDEEDFVPCPCQFTPLMKQQKQQPPPQNVLLYRDCCAPFHRSQKKCTTPTEVVRTRYSAFAYRLVPYIMETTHPTCRDYQDNKIAWAKDLNRAGMFDSFELNGLHIGPEIYDANDDNNEDIDRPSHSNRATIEIEVHMKARQESSRTAKENNDDDDPAAIAGQETIIQEKSVFLRDSEGVWSYASGDVRSQVAGLEDTRLNP